MDGDVSEELNNVLDNESGNNDKSSQDEDIVDPWNVMSKADTGIDYNKLISKSLILV